MCPPFCCIRLSPFTAKTAEPIEMQLDEDLRGPIVVKFELFELYSLLELY